MDTFIDVTEENKEDYNAVVNHPLQSYEWGEFRKKTGVKVIRRAQIKNGKITNGFTLTLHKVPKTKLYIGYLPKGDKPTDELLSELKKIGNEHNCIFIQLEPNVHAGLWENNNLKPAAHPLFTKYTFILNISKTEDEIMAGMHSKTRYNIRVAEKHKVSVVEDNSEESFKGYLKLMHETTNRQGFYAHTPAYHKSLWETIPKIANKNGLSYHLLNAKYKPNEASQTTLTTWVLFAFKDHIYYPYGASSRQYREVMANNLIAWEAIRFGKKIGANDFDMWGALGPEPDKNDPWYGFHRFKEGYGAELVEFVGSYDLVINPLAYEIYKVADKLRWAVLKIKTKLS